MLPSVDTDPDAVLPRAVDLHRQIRGIVTAVVVLSRVTSLGMVALSVAALVRVHGYTSPRLALATYTVVALWNVAYLPLVGRRDPIPRWVLVYDVAVTAAAVVTLPWAIRGALATNVAVPDFEALTVAAVVAVALVSASVRATVAGCLSLAGAYAAAQLPGPGHQDLASTLNVIGWQAATASCA